MNYGAIEYLLKNYLTKLEKKGLGGSEAKIKELIKKEVPNLLKKLLEEGNLKGLNKEELLTYLEDVFGSKNFASGKYKGGKETIIATIDEIFGKENIVN